MNETYDKMKQRAKDTMTIKEHDTPHNIVTKVGVVQELNSFLDKLFDWVVEKLLYIFTLIKQALPWCMQKVKDLFLFLKDLFLYI